MDDGGVLDDTAVVGVDVIIVLKAINENGVIHISSKLPGLVEEAPGVSFTSPDLGQARRGGVATCPPGDAPPVGVANLGGKRREARELLKNRLSIIINLMI